MTVFVGALLVGRVAYGVIEKVMWFVAIFTLVGLVWACTHPDILKVIPEFSSGLIWPQWPEGRVWDPKDATKLLTAITFAGLGGFWTLFYSYWLREKGAGMASHMGQITSPITGHLQQIPLVGFRPKQEPQLQSKWRQWQRYLLVDSGIGIGGNLLTTLMTCLLAYALLFPEGLLPQKYEIAVVQARFFEVQWGIMGRILFLLVAAAFLADTWLATVDAVARIHTDVLLSYFKRARAKSARWWYFLLVGFLTTVTGVTMLFDAPGPLILLSAVIGFLGTVLFTGALLLVIYKLLPQMVPTELRSGKFALAALSTSYAAYLLLAAAYLWTVFR